MKQELDIFQWFVASFRQKSQDEKNTENQKKDEYAVKAIHPKIGDDI